MIDELHRIFILFGNIVIDVLVVVVPLSLEATSCRAKFIILPHKLEIVPYLFFESLK